MSRAERMVGKQCHVTRFRLANGRGIEVEILDHGATLARVRAPDRRGQLGDVVPGFDRAEEYVSHHPHLGCIVGRCANRIANSEFVLDGVTWRLTPNVGPHHLHGGPGGFGQRRWRCGRTGKEEAGEMVELHLESEHGDQGYPGTVSVTARYTLDAIDTLRLTVTATTDRATPVNLAAHPYFNLADDPAEGISSHLLAVYADHYLPISDAWLPTGEVAPVAGTPFDLRTPARLRERLCAEHPQLALAGGFDHNFVTNGMGLRDVAWLCDTESGRTLTITTDQPGLQVYSSNGLGIRGRGGACWGRHSAICLEAQGFPNAPNEPRFPSVVLRPGETYRMTTAWRFGVLAC